MWSDVVTKNWVQGEEDSSGRKLASGTIVAVIADACKFRWTCIVVLIAMPIVFTWIVSLTIVVHRVIEEKTIGKAI